MGIQRGKLKVPDFQGKVESILSKLGVSAQVLVSTGSGPYRKPGLGMWTYFTQHVSITQLDMASVKALECTVFNGKLA